MSNDKTSRRFILAKEKASRAFRLRAEGWTYAEIAGQLGYQNPSSARKALLRALDSLLPIEEANEIRRLESARLDALHAKLWSSAMDGDMTAIAGVLRIMERRAKLLGLDAPAGIRIGGERDHPIQVETPERPELSGEDAIAVIREFVVLCGGDPSILDGAKEGQGIPEEEEADRAVSVEAGKGLSQIARHVEEDEDDDLPEDWRP